MRDVTGNRDVVDAAILPCLKASGAAIAAFGSRPVGRFNDFYLPVLRNAREFLREARAGCGEKYKKAADYNCSNETGNHFATP
jgi:hypothetical protein